MVQDEKKYKALVIASGILCTMGIIFLVISIQSFWYRYTVKRDIRQHYKQYIMTMEEMFLETYIKDASFIATQKPIIDAVKNEKKKEKNMDLLPFEYFLLHNPAFMRGYVVNIQNVITREIARTPSDTQSTLAINPQFAQQVLTNNAIEIYTHKDYIVDVGIPVYNEETLIGAVVLSFSLPITKAEYIESLTQKQLKELASDLFNRKEFIYSLAIVGVAFILMGIILYSIYQHINTGYSFFERIWKKRDASKNEYTS